MTNSYWLSPVGEKDDFGQPIGDVIYDAKTRMGPWALMSQRSWVNYAFSPLLGTGYGQRYEKQEDGRWLKTAG
jgi:hypothetical protein